MTCVVGVVENGVVWMGADSFSGNGYFCSKSSLPKVFLRDGILLGTAGDWRGSALLQNMEVPACPDDMPVELYLAGLFVGAMREHFRAHGFLQEVNSQQQTEDMQILIGFRGRLFALWQQFQVTESLEGYEAIGAGMYVAAGALYAAQQMKLPVAEQLEMSLMAARAHHPVVRPPFVMMNEHGHVE